MDDLLELLLDTTRYVVEYIRCADVRHWFSVTMALGKWLEMRNYRVFEDCIEMICYPRKGFDPEALGELLWLIVQEIYNMDPTLLNAYKYMIDIVKVE